MTPARRLAPAEVPGLATRRIAADILDNVLRRSRPLDDELDGSRGASRTCLACGSRPRAGAQAGRDRSAPARHAPASVRPLSRKWPAGRCAAYRNRPADRRRADPVSRRAGPCRGRPERRRAGRPERRDVSRPGQCGAAQRDARRPSAIAALDPVPLDTPDWLLARWQRGLWRRDRPRYRDRPWPRAAARSHGRVRPGLLGAASARPRPADRHGAHRHSGEVPLLPGYHEGAWWVQDAAAALPARLFGDVAGKQSPICARRPAARPRSLRSGASVRRSTVRRTGSCACAKISRVLAWLPR